MSQMSNSKVNKNLVIVNTGNGKGKSTSAFGVLLRALNGWEIAKDKTTSQNYDLIILKERFT